jgi:hypothetical protein
MLNWIAETWCKTMHKGPMWPIHGRYTCSECLREYTVPWEGPVMEEEYADPELRQQLTVSTQTATAIQ